jgi:glutamate carboxypeptidase
MRVNPMSNTRAGFISLCMVPLLFVWASTAFGRDEAVYRAVTAKRDAVVSLLQKLVNIDSGSDDKEGGERIHQILEPMLKESGATVRYETAEAPNLAPNLVATYRGSGTAKILIIAHIDTVFQRGDAAKRPFRIEGERAYGPGVGDEKGGVVNALIALEILHELGFKKYGSITLLLDGSEEMVSAGSTQLIKALARQSDLAFNMEGGDAPDAITVWRKGGGQIALEVQGRAAHAGMAPQEGHNAALELMHQLAHLEGKFPSSGDGITVNLTVLKAGDRTNIIPDAAQAIFDVRYRDFKDFDKILARLRAAIQPVAIAGTSVSMRIDGGAYPALIESARTDELGHKAQAIYAELGRKLALSGNGGASESAIANEEGIPVLDGLGYVGDKAHTDHEWIDTSSIVPRLYLMTRLLEEAAVKTTVARQPPPGAH